MNHDAPGFGSQEREPDLTWLIGVSAAGPVCRGRQPGELVAGGGRVACLSGATGQDVLGIQGAGVVDAEQPLLGAKHSSLEFQCGTVPAPLAEVIREPGHAAGVLAEGRLGVWQQRGTDGPGLRRARIVRDSRLDQSRSGLPPLPHFGL